MLQRPQVLCRFDCNYISLKQITYLFNVLNFFTPFFSGYIMGKAEGSGENWHGHVTAVTCSPQHRRLGLAASLMASLEEISEKKRCYFVDLFVRVSNQVAITMYKNLGYTVYRTVLQYYRYKKKN